MPSLTLKDVPADLLDRLRERAERNRRSLNQEVITILERHTPRPASPKELAHLERLQREVRAAMARPLSADEVVAMIRQDRESR